MKRYGVLLAAALLLAGCSALPGLSGEESQPESSREVSVLEESSLPEESSSLPVSAPVSEPSFSSQESEEVSEGESSFASEPSQPPAEPSQPPLDSGEEKITAAVMAFSEKSWFDHSLIDRYEHFVSVFPDFEVEKALIYVNIGLDHAFYTGVEQITDPDNILVLVNKYHTLGADYAPSDLVRIADPYNAGNVYLRAEAAAAFEQMCADAAGLGYTLAGASGYRSYAYQDGLYQSYVARDGVDIADTYSARPGFSEHQTGLAMDVMGSGVPYYNFVQTAEYGWVKENAHRYGFIIHYLPNSQWVTGYKTEEWHIRYIGPEHAQRLYQMGITFDEYCAMGLAE